MQGEEEVSIATNALELKTKNSKQFKIIAGKSEYVSSAHNTGLEYLEFITDDSKCNSKTTKVQVDNDGTETVQPCMQIKVTHCLQEQMQKLLNHSLTLHEQLTKQPK
jgi:hypothetical protein